jgi:type I restriction enzyme S subunit
MTSNLPTGLPSSWAMALIGDICEVNPKLDKAGISEFLKVSFVPMPAVEAKTGRINVSDAKLFRDVKKGYTLFKEGDLLFAKITPCMENGKIAVVPPVTGGIGAGSTEFHVLRPRSGIDIRYLYYYISSEAFRREAEHNMTGAVGQRRVPTRYLARQAIPLPPISEQHRIVAKVEKLFDELDRGAKSLTSVRRQIIAYRQSVLKAAFAGEFTKSAGGDWRTRSVGELITDIRYGTAKKCAVDVRKTAVLRIPNVASGKIDLTDLKHAEFSKEELEKLRLESGDILLVRSNGSASLVGLSAVVTSEAEGYAYAGYLIRIRLKREIILPDFLHLYLQSPAVRNEIEHRARSTSGVHNINGDEIRALRLPVPSITVQRKVIKSVNKHLSSAELLEACAAAELARYAMFRHSILMEAFAGRISPQDDEKGAAPTLSASVFIELKGDEKMGDRSTKSVKRAAA